MMDFNNLYYFYLVAENGGYTAAQKASGITKSLLSRRISDLEEQLNVRLINRNTHSFSLTNTGQVLFERAEAMVREGINAYESVSALTTEPMGVIRISCPPVLAQYHLAPHLPGFMKKYPRVSVNIEATNRQVHLIEEMFDVVLRASSNFDDVQGLIAKPISTTQPLLVASHEFLETYGCPETLQDLKNFRTISSVVDQYEGVQKWTFTHKNGDKSAVKHKPVLFCRNPRVQLEAVLNGLGIGLIPHFSVQKHIRDKKLVIILEDWATETHYIHALYQSRKHMNPAVRAFLDYMSEPLHTSLVNS